MKWSKGKEEFLHVLLHYGVPKCLANIVLQYDPLYVACTLCFSTRSFTGSATTYCYYGLHGNLIPYERIWEWTDFGDLHDIENHSLTVSSLDSVPEADLLEREKQLYLGFCQTRFLKPPLQEDMPITEAQKAGLQAIYCSNPRISSEKLQIC